MTKPTRHPLASRAFLMALLLNGIWINLSEVLRYFGLVKPMLHEAFPNNPDIAAVTPTIFASWMAWDTILVIAASGFYWMFLERNGRSLSNAAMAASLFTLTVFGLIWLGIVNMGLAPIQIMVFALPLAWLEQVLAAIIVWAIFSKADQQKTVDPFTP